MSSGNTDQYRDLATQIVKRAEKDKDFAAKAKADPVGTLTAAGIPGDVAKEMLPGDATEVSGYLRCQDLTCWSSECPGTCHVSLVGGPI